MGVGGVEFLMFAGVGGADAVGPAGPSITSA
jgi:hypothetical protein